MEVQVEPVSHEDHTSMVDMLTCGDYRPTDKLVQEATQLLEMLLVFGVGCEAAKQKIIELYSQPQNHQADHKQP